MLLKTLSALLFSGSIVAHVAAINEPACPKPDPISPPSEFTCPDLKPPKGFVPKNIIIDTDLLSFTDDVAAVAVANILQTMGFVNILGIVSDVTSKFSLPAIDAINTWYCHPDIPLARDSKTTNDTTEPNIKIGPQYITQLSNPDCFPEDFKSLLPKDVKDPVEFYEETLQKHKDVTIVAIGFLNNLDKLYKKLLDKNNTKLITDNVAELVVQGGSCNTSNHIHGAGYNLVNSGSSAQVLTKWPSLVTYFPGFEANLSNPSVQAACSLPKNNPVRFAYDTITADNKFGPHDILATYYAIFGLRNLGNSTNLFQYGNKTTTGALQLIPKPSPTTWASFWNDDAELEPPQVQRFIIVNPTDVPAINKTVNDLVSCYGKERETCGGH